LTARPEPSEHKQHNEHPKQTPIFVKAMPLSEYNDITKIKDELNSGNVLIVKITPLAIKSIEDVKKAIDELKMYVESVKGDIARLGEERIVITPNPIKIWRKKLGETTTYVTHTTETTKLT
jgi:SepF-like predicted cell division protein (DUF552 family)